SRLTPRPLIRFAAVVVAAEVAPAAAADRPGAQRAPVAGVAVVAQADGPRAASHRVHTLGEVADGLPHVPFVTLGCRVHVRLLVGLPPRPGSERERCGFSIRCPPLRQVWMSGTAPYRPPTLTVTVTCHPPSPCGTSSALPGSRSPRRPAPWPGPPPRAAAAAAGPAPSC